MYKTKTKTTACKTKTKTDFLVSDRSCPKTDGLRPHHWWALNEPMNDADKIWISYSLADYINKQTVNRKYNSNIVQLTEAPAMPCSKPYLSTKYY